MPMEDSEGLYGWINPYSVIDTAGWIMMRQEERNNLFFKRHAERRGKLEESSRGSAPPCPSGESGGNIGE